MPPSIADRIARERDEVARRSRLWRPVCPRVPLTGRSVVLVDDAVATGASLVAAARSLRRLQPAELCVAVPVIAADALAIAAPVADRLACLRIVEAFAGVGRWYAEPPPGDERVLATLQMARAPWALPPSRPPVIEEALRMDRAGEGILLE